MNNNQQPYQPVITDTPSPGKNFIGDIVFYGLILFALSLISGLISSVVGLFLWVILYQTTSVGFWGYWQVCFFVVLLGEVILFYSFLRDLRKKREEEEKEDNEDA